MKVDVLLGLQWGDEGKGKIVDVLAPRYDIVARFQGGPNAGHTIEFEGHKFILHTIPSGIFISHVTTVIGNGVILDPGILLNEINKVRDFGIRVDDRLRISKKAHLILPSHRLLDAAFEWSKGKESVGSTLKGIGPTYTDKIARTGIRIGEAGSPDFMAKYNSLKDYHFRLANMLGYDISSLKIDGQDFQTYEKGWFDALQSISGLQIIDSEYFLNQSLDDGKTILAEGAQGSLLDIDFGSYPFVTSSNTTVAGACAGLGIAPSRIGKVLGIFKAYCTRVGNGPFPTELFDETGQMLRDKGVEFGSTTGRPRRCGWLDMVALKYSVMLSGVNELFMMKADVLNDLDMLEVGMAYTDEEGKQTTQFPFDICARKYTPVYTGLPGWKTSMADVRTASAMPGPLAAYIRFIEKHTGVKVSLVSTGPDRTQTIHL